MLNSGFKEIVQCYIRDWLDSNVWDDKYNGIDGIIIMKADTLKLNGLGRRKD